MTAEAVHGFSLTAANAKSAGAEIKLRSVTVIRFNRIVT
jgi:hypothetical protein